MRAQKSCALKALLVYYYRFPEIVSGGDYPLEYARALTMMKLAPALMTGNTIVVKPSPNSPLALTILLGRMATVLPTGVINVVLGDVDVGSALTSHPPLFAYTDFHSMRLLK